MAEKKTRNPDTPSARAQAYGRAMATQARWQAKVAGLKADLRQAESALAGAKADVADARDRLDEIAGEFE